jgi:hypothetical protein
VSTAKKVYENTFSRQLRRHKYQDRDTPDSSKWLEAPADRICG